MTYLFKNKKVGAVALLLFAAGFIAYYTLFTDTPPPEEEAKRIEVEVVEKTSLQRTATLVGTLRPIRQTTFTAHEKGVLGPIQVKEGDVVEAGTLLAEIDNAEILREVEHARESVELLQTNHDRQVKLVRLKNKSKQSLEKSKEELLKAKMELEKSVSKLKKTQFRAPYKGTCGIFIAREGQDLEDGDKVLSFYDIEKYALDIGVPGSILPQLGPKTRFECLGQKGVLTSVQKVIDPESRQGLAHGEIEPDPTVCLGSLVDVKVVVFHKKDCFSLPKQAVFMKGNALFVYKIKDGKAALTPVQLGLEGDHRVEILSGIELGDQVVLKAQETLWPTRSLKAVEPAASQSSRVKNQPETSSPSKDTKKA